MLETFTECKIYKNFTSHKLALFLIAHIIPDDINLTDALPKSTSTHFIRQILILQGESMLI